MKLKDLILKHGLPIKVQRTDLGIYSFSQHGASVWHPIEGPELIITDIHPWHPRWYLREYNGQLIEMCDDQESDHWRII